MATSDTIDERNGIPDEKKIIERDPSITLVAGAISSLSSLWLPMETRKSMALYAFARVLQSLYNDARQQEIWPTRGGWLLDTLREYGDSLLFMLTTGQVMYAYVAAPWSLPHSYYMFIVNTGPMHLTALQAMRRRCSYRPLPVEAMQRHYASAQGVRHHGPFPAAALGLRDSHTTETVTAVYAAGAAGATLLSETTTTTRGAVDAVRNAVLLPCSVLHPQATTCKRAAWLTFRNAAQRTLPVYGTVFGLAALYRGRKSLEKPVATVQHVGMSTARSTVFLSSFVAACMALVCLTRRVMPREMAWAYWLLAFVASGTIFIERKSRRAELALYVLPRALDSAHLCAASAAALLRYYCHQPDVLHPLLVKAVDMLYGGLARGTSDVVRHIAPSDNDDADDDDADFSRGKTPLPV
eukprot:CAMPEP_0168594570 /NCGR_PEP_ID=MMETSP0420-20121227/8973_1 /TAXON_ID=498008 /ORGANISM="Pessonella sp." /LENGTH=410 /DNA_ID=CAMNT_0008630907 /DNA_START=374 /DNA_END=1606 /DNA_ORIENTATION=-